MALDAIGWQLVESLVSSPALQGVTCVVVRDPSILPAELAGVRQAVLIDAADWPLGKVELIPPDELSRSARLSSHALSVPDALTLADSLNPGLTVSIIGVGIRGEGMSLYQLGDATLPRVSELVRKVFNLA